MAEIARVVGRPTLVVVPTADLAERTYADLTYYLGDGAPLALVRPREDGIGVLENPSERSARMTLLADLAAGRPLVAVAPLAALRQYVVPVAVFSELSFSLRAGDEPGWDALQERLYHLGYRRADVVSAAGEYAVRGGILDVFPATSDTPLRFEFFGDTIESIRAFDLMSQRSDGADPVADAVPIVPWAEIPRDETTRARLLERIEGAPDVVSAARRYIAGGGALPKLAPVRLRRAGDAARLPITRRIGRRRGAALLATIERGLEEERSREEEVLLADVRSGELAIDDDAVGDALLGEVPPRRCGWPTSARG